jgi:hypothetical protein
MKVIGLLGKEFEVVVWPITIEEKLSPEIIKSLKKK